MAYKDDYTGKRMALANGAIEHCDSCTDKITGDYIRVADVHPDGRQMDFIYCLECGTEEELPCDFYNNFDHSNCNSEGCLFDSGIAIIE